MELHKSRYFPVARFTYTFSSPNNERFTSSLLHGCSYSNYVNHSTKLSKYAINARRILTNCLIASIRGVFEIKIVTSSNSCNFSSGMEALQKITSKTQILHHDGNNGKRMSLAKNCFNDNRSWSLQYKNFSS